MRAFLLAPLLVVGCASLIGPKDTDLSTTDDGGDSDGGIDDDGGSNGGGHHGGRDTDVDPPDSGTLETEPPVDTEDSDPPADSDVVDTDVVDTDVVDSDVTPADTDLADTDPGVDTDTDVAPTPFLPDRVSYIAEFAVDATGAMRSFFYDGIEYQPYLEIVLDDGVDYCALDYQVGPSTFDWYGSANPIGEVWTWLDRNDIDADFGFEVDAGGYTGITVAGGRCADLPAGYLVPDVYEWVRLLDGSPPTVEPLFVGVGGAPSQAASSLAASEWGVPTAKVIGAQITLPFLFGPVASPQDTLDGFALWAHVDAQHAIVLDRQGYVVLEDASGASVATQPSEGWFHVEAAYSITFTPP